MRGGYSYPIKVHKKNKNFSEGQELISGLGCQFGGLRLGMGLRLGVGLGLRLKGRLR